MQVFMAKYRIAWLPGDGIGMEVREAAGVDERDDLEITAAEVVKNTTGNCPSPTSPKQQYERYPDCL
jgi:isocitrate/isopropylmalate dehydrogenase